ncbi:MAG: hypothetical protein J6K58_06605 [Lachnospiraceae bacterium]|nr:hypothetical protein [Lachnospiraceae bacterium]
MKTWKLISGILSCVLFILVALQSCAAGFVDAVEGTGGTGGGSGILVAVLMLAGGIVSIASCKAKGKGGNIALIILFGLAALIGFAGHGVFKDLIIWSAWCLVCGVLAIVSLVKGNKNLGQES